MHPNLPKSISIYSSFFFCFFAQILLIFWVSNNKKTCIKSGECTLQFIEMLLTLKYIYFRSLRMLLYANFSFFYSMYLLSYKIESVSIFFFLLLFVIQFILSVIINTVHICDPVFGYFRMRWFIVFYSISISFHWACFTDRIDCGLFFASVFIIESSTWYYVFLLFAYK